MEDFVFVRHLHGVGHQGERVYHDDRFVAGLNLHPCGQFVLLLKDFFQFALHLTAGVVVVQRAQKRGELPRVVGDLVKMILVLVIAGVVLRGTLDFFLQLLFQILIVLLCSTNIAVFRCVDGLAADLRGAGKENRAGRKGRHDQKQKHKKNAHNH